MSIPVLPCDFTVFCIEPFPHHFSTCWTHLIFKASYLTHFLTNHLENSYIASHIWYLDAPMSMRLYFSFWISNFLYPCYFLAPQLNISYTCYSLFCAPKIFVNTIWYVKTACGFFWAKESDAWIQRIKFVWWKDLPIALYHIWTWFRHLWIVTYW